MDGVVYRVFLSHDPADEYEVAGFLAATNLESAIFSRRQPLADCRATALLPVDTNQAAVAVRQGAMRDCAVTVVLVGARTWACKEVDTEIRASLLPGPDGLSSGLLGIVLPSAGRQPMAPRGLRRQLPQRTSDDGYARWCWYPALQQDVIAWLDDAYTARRTRARLIAPEKMAPGYLPQQPLGIYFHQAQPAVAQPMASRG